MSGINSLIDTVLHQVLGKRIDTAPPRELNEPVRPISPSDAPRALHSDSRLDARSRSAVVPALYRSGREAPAAAPAPRGSGEVVAPASTQTHFTPAARSIADVLLRFPAPPSSLRPTGPLVAATESSSAAVIADRLQLSVRDSGLFYESHLNRWYRGDMPRDQLLREPQHLRLQIFVPVTATLSRDVMSPLKPAQGTESLERGATMPGREVPWSAVREPVHESLQGIVRHQLEMLVTPVLRWEGDVWTGLFMALVLQVPVAEQEDATGEEGQESGSEQEGWRSAMTLQVAGFGEVRVSVWLQGARLDIGLSAPEPAVRRALESGLERLKVSLAALDLEEVKVRVFEEALDE
ncbi:MAG: flagellar hook-length control protein FliK [Pseudomonadota bacterium]